MHIIMEFTGFKGNDREQKSSRIGTTLFFMSLVAGDDSVETDQGLHLVYMHAGLNPFEVIDQAVK